MTSETAIKLMHQVIEQARKHHETMKPLPQELLWHSEGALGAYCNVAATMQGFALYEQYRKELMEMGKPVEVAA
ncbi:hypothetical protein SAMN06265795_12627 [Noviherbaspirillum humi]|uniref:Uncharacterized protein n=1 Tax=Noviherbaspirillum humi TaxID=1688639 RepID=A0A239LS48_9BURK|nr:hypothetical protein [Noviherbaspirillum humi]SNT33507.1 hypothetical protein SAMN06265795_12627 [Noviherbaspirillum humi]